MDMSDEDVPTCPLCLEELDTTDRSVKACQCGYQVCLWCLNTIRKQHNGRCPACRTPYEETKFKFVEVNPQQAAREARERANAKKERERRLKAKEAEMERARAFAITLQKARTNLKHARIEQRNLVYVMGLSLTLAREEVLRRPDMFGKFGRLLRVLINKSQPYNADAPGGPSISAYIQYLRESDASSAVRQMNNEVFDGREIRCSIATTKYCDSYLARLSAQNSGQAHSHYSTCGNPDCLYLHEAAPPEDVLTIEEVNARQLGPPPPPHLFQTHRRHIYDRRAIPYPSSSSPPSMRPNGKPLGSRSPPLRVQNGSPELGANPPSSYPLRRNAHRTMASNQSSEIRRSQGIPASSSSMSRRNFHQVDTTNHLASFRQSSGRSSSKMSTGLPSSSRAGPATSPPGFQQIAAATAASKPAHPPGFDVPSVPPGFDRPLPSIEVKQPKAAMNPAVAAAWSHNSSSNVTRGGELNNLNFLLARLGGRNSAGGSSQQSSRNSVAPIGPGKDDAGTTETSTDEMRGDIRGESLYQNGKDAQISQGVNNSLERGHILHDETKAKEDTRLTGRGRPPPLHGQGDRRRSMFAFAQKGADDSGRTADPAKLIRTSQQREKSRFKFASLAQGLSASACQAMPPSSGTAEERKGLSADEQKPCKTLCKIHEEFRRPFAVVLDSSDFYSMSTEDKLALIFSQPDQDRTRTPAARDLSIESVEDLSRALLEVTSIQSSESADDVQRALRPAAPPVGTSLGRKRYSDVEEKARSALSSATASGNDENESATVETEEYLSSDNFENAEDERKRSRAQRKRDKKARQQRERMERRASAQAAKAADPAGSAAGGNEAPSAASSTENGVKAAPELQSKGKGKEPQKSEQLEEDVSPVLATAAEAPAQENEVVERTMSVSELQREVEAAREREAVLQNRLLDLQQQIMQYDNIRT